MKLSQFLESKKAEKRLAKKAEKNKDYASSSPSIENIGRYKTLKNKPVKLDFSETLPPDVKKIVQYDPLAKIYIDELNFIDKDYKSAQVVFDDLENTWKYEYMDTVRVYTLGEPSQVEQYERIADKGCCGSATFITKVQGKLTMVGINFGH